ncbi:MAG: hypothetical protein NTY06_02830 [Candidatus Gottesmanbacteria bacterium]|nr:hypothetical protein [Candidatus Gottesmanbacteria bacterium]
MKKLFFGIVSGIALTILGYYGYHASVRYISLHATVSPLGKILEKPLEKYSILRLSGRIFTGGQIVLDQATATTSAYTCLHVSLSFRR